MQSETMKKADIKKIAERINFRDLFIIVAGTFLMGAAINFMFDPIGLDTGGVSGLSILVRYASKPFLSGLGIDFFKDGIPVWLCTLALNIPLFAAAIWKKGWRFLAKTTYSTALLTAWIYVLPVKQVLNDTLLSAIAGGVLSGTGIGLVFSTLATTGGSDLFAALVHDRLRHLSVSWILAFVDGTIVFLGLFVFPLENVVYSVIVVFLVSKISDEIVEGLKFAKVAFIISPKADTIATEILEDIDRGVTGIRVKGMYSGEDKNMLFCVVSKKQIPELQDIVMRHDNRAFMVISDAREVMGEGFSRA
jgi:uncharacterized membrane-anchored protein YitT (DUF2179 family)